MILASMILILSVALFLFYVQATCQKILARKCGEDYFQTIVDANRLEFPFVEKALKGESASLHKPHNAKKLKALEKYAQGKGVNVTDGDGQLKLTAGRKG